VAGTWRKEGVPSTYRPLREEALREEEALCGVQKRVGEIKRLKRKK